MWTTAQPTANIRKQWAKLCVCVCVLVCSTYPAVKLCGRADRHAFIVYTCAHVWESIIGDSAPMHTTLCGGVETLLLPSFIISMSLSSPVICTPCSVYVYINIYMLQNITSNTDVWDSLQLHSMRTKQNTKNKRARFTLTTTPGALQIPKVLMTRLDGRDEIWQAR